MELLVDPAPNWLRALRVEVNGERLAFRLSDAHYGSPSGTILCRIAHITAKIQFRLEIISASVSGTTNRK